MSTYTIAGIKVEVTGLNFLSDTSEGAVRKLILSFHNEELALLNLFQRLGGKVYLTESQEFHALFTSNVEDGVEVPIIVINSLLKPHALMKGTIYHELQHFFQWKRGDLGFKHNEFGVAAALLWKGRETGVPTTMNEYLQDPAEIEAFTKQFEWLKRTGQTKLPVSMQMTKLKINLKLTGVVQKFLQA